MKSVYHFILFSALLGLLLLLIFIAQVIGSIHPVMPQMLLTNGLPLCLSYLLAGIGIGLPLILIAAIFGWFQFLLLLTGHIDPHLTQAGFWTVLKTLFSKI